MGTDDDRACDALAREGLLLAELPDDDFAPAVLVLLQRVARREGLLGADRELAVARLAELAASFHEAIEDADRAHVSPSLLTVVDRRVGQSILRFHVQPAQDGCRYLATWRQRDRVHAAGPAPSKGAALNEAVALAHLLALEPEP